MDRPKFIASNQKEEFIIVYKGLQPANGHLFSVLSYLFLRYTSQLYWICINILTYEIQRLFK